MTRLFLLLFCSLFLVTAANAVDWSGHWVARSGSTAMFDIHVVGTTTPTSAVWIRPDSFTVTSTGEAIKVSGPLLRLGASRIVESPGAVSLTFRKPGAGSDTTFILRRREGLPVSLEFANPLAEAQFEPVDLQRSSNEPHWSKWVASTIYRFDRSRPSNAEMKAMFDADQGERETLFQRKLPDGSLDPKLDMALTKAEAVRLARTRQLLDQGDLNSGADFYYASFIFQHGGKPEDFLLAHVLATAAMARGYDASWIASATLDRYLQTIGKPQVFGTQYQKPQGSGWTQTPYDSDLLPNSLRKVMGAPNKASQASKLKDM